MSLCNGCGGVIGQDCFNPQECEWIAQEEERRFAAALADVDGEQEWRFCGDAAKDRQTGELFYCGLRSNHVGPHRWNERSGDQIRQCSWIKTGHITAVGGKS